MTNKIHALYVDDEVELLKIGKIFLELSGDITVTPAPGVLEAIDLIKEQLFDVIISDYQMPGMDGIAFLKYLKQEGNVIPFILFTGKGREEVVIEALNNGASFYLQKGGEPGAQFAELSNQIHYAVDRRRADQDLIESEKKLTDIIDFFPDPTFVINLEGVVIAWNRAIEEMSEINKGEMIGQGDHAYTIPFYGVRRLQLLDLVDQKEEEIRSKYQSFQKKGNTLYADVFAPALYGGKGGYVWAVAGPLLDVHGNRVGAIESIRDITDRKFTEQELLQKNEELQAAYEQIAASEKELRSNLDELSRQEELVRKSEEQFQSLFMNMIDGAALHNLTYSHEGIPEDYIIIKTNPAFEKHLGILGAVIGKTSREAFGVTEPPYLDIYARVAQTGEPEVFETYFPPLQKYFSISAYCPYLGSFATIFEDITERKLVEIELRRKNEELHAAYEEIAATEEELRTNLDELTRQESLLREHDTRLRMAQEIGQIGCWEFDLATGVYWGSDETFRILGTPRPDDGVFTLKQFEDAIPEQKWVNQALIDLISLGSEYDLEYLVRPVDDSTHRMVHSVARLERDEQGNQKVIGIIQDITKRKEADEKLRQTNAYLENLISIANVPIIVWDPSFRITRLNHAYELVIGRSGDDVIGRSLEILFPPNQAERSMRLIRTTQEGVRWDTVEIDNLHRDGSLRTLLWNSATLYSADGVTPIATIAQGHDITEERRLEREKDAALVQIQQNLSYLAILNDGIRNPLTIILTLADMIEDTDVAKEISCQTSRIDEIVSQLDQRWMKSEKVLNAIRKHYQVQAVQSGVMNPCDVEHTSESKPEILMEEVQAQLYIILDSIEALVYVADMETHDLLFMNHQGRSLFGDSAGQKCYQILHNFQDAPCSFCTNHTLVDEFGPTGVHQGEFQNIKTGRWYDFRDRAIRWTDGRLVRLEIATDITERKQVEMELVSAQESLKEVHRLAHIGTWDWFIETDTVTWSEELYEIAGRDSHLPAPSYAEHSPLYAPSSWEQLQKVVTNTLATGDPYNLELEFIRPDGSTRWAHEFGGVKRDDSGSIVMLHGIVQDITQRKQAEKALLEKTEELDQYFMTCLDLFCIADTDGYLRRLNPEWEKTLGYTLAELQGYRLLDFVHPDDLSATLAAMAGLNSQKEVMNFTNRYRHKDGSYRWIEWRAFPVLQNNRVYTAARDISDQKQAEEALSASNQRLRLLTSLTRHDIFNQLSGIDLFHNLALQTSDLGKIHEYLTHAKQAGNRIETIIGFTREYEDFGVASSGWQRIYHIVESAKDEVILNNVTVEISIPEDLEIYADPIIRKVFSTLLQNAIRHGGAITSIRLTSQTCEDSLILACSDDGIGIPEEEKIHIFDHGYGKNTGIGLFLAREILSISGLSIRECGTAGEGARFEILVPAGKYRIIPRT